MFVNESLKTHFETSSTVQIESLILAEWNMNMPDNIYKLGNYRYRPLGSDLKFKNLPNVFDPYDSGNYYTGATDADVVIDGGYSNDGTPQSFTSVKQKMNMLYSLEDCLKPFRPRSGINKATFLNNKFLANSGKQISERPRYYMASRDDEFKYWTSFRTENSVEYGISNINSNGVFYINDTAPFVVYKEAVPTNRIIIKMQTNIGTVDLGPFSNSISTINDPLFNNSYQTTPNRWKIQYLDGTSWNDAYVFDENSIRNDGTKIIDANGYIELQYGAIIPIIYQDSFKFIGTISSTSLLPTTAIHGEAYLVVENENEQGNFYIWHQDANGYESFVANYGWNLGQEQINNDTTFVTDLTSPVKFDSNLNGKATYREFQYIKGIRLVIETMNKFDCTFDLIEMSPRLVVNISDKVVEYTVKKSLSDLGTTSLPVGQLLASTGTISLFDYDQSFNQNNSSSIVSKYIRKNIKFSFYENIINVDSYNYYVPIKTLYSEGFPEANVTASTLEFNLRDLYFLLESMPAPRMLVTEVSLSYAISLLLDSIGFTNYKFLRLDNEAEQIIPFFFIAPDQNVAEVLNQLAVSSQSAMFFDEYNNFVIMSKNYLMPTELDRPTDFIISGSNTQSDTGVVENLSSGNLPNLISISSQNKKIYNGGQINYTTRYIQRSQGSIESASKLDNEKTWKYSPVLLWEVSGTDQTKTINEVVSKQGKYVLGAVPINSNVTNSLPTVVNHSLTNNIVDLGENVYWLTRNQGYFYSNGEIIKYDAVEYSVTGIGNVWIQDNQDYQRYFQSLPFNGKIYPTGRIRIYAVPFYETLDGVTRLKDGDVSEHGRGQFGTSVTNHYAGIDSYWSNDSNVRGCSIETETLFTTKLLSDIEFPATTLGAAGVNNTLAKETTRSGIIKNFLATNFMTETEVNHLKSTQSGTIQSSALILNGPSFQPTEKPLGFMSYVYKELNNAYKHFGTRMRIVGKIDSNDSKTQTPIGSTSYYEVSNTSTDQTINISGGSGGLGILLNPETNNGYYFEIVALGKDDISSYLNTDTNGESDIAINNVLFYKIKKDASTDKAIPIKLWGGLSKIIVDDGRFAGQYRTANEDNPTVYDLSVEYIDIGGTRKFYLYINNKLIQIVTDTDPLPIYNNMALFIRGSSRCMFENIYALSENYSQNSVFTTGQTISETFGGGEVNATDALRKYSMSGMVQSTYLSGISSQEHPKYNMYFDEFGSIFRECAYFNIKYDRAYPALYAQLSPTINRIKGYTTSGFYANSYGAEFLIFNATDRALNLDETTGNYLRIQGITFTQDTTHELTVDEYFAKRGNLSNTELQGSTIVRSPLLEESKYDEIKLSRMIYGKNEFSINTPYIQTQDDAQSLMGWIIDRLMIPKRNVGVSIFSIPTLQLGDIVTVNYKDSDGMDLAVPSESRFVIYNIEYSRTINGPTMNIYLAEV
jgi:hypothetical protein